MNIDSIITLDKSELSRQEWERLFRRLTYMDADETEIMAFDYVPGRNLVRLPRGTLDMLPAKQYEINDRRACPSMPKVQYVRELDADGYTGQVEAVRAMYKHRQGQVIAPPGSGKTEIVLAFAAGCKTRTLVIVHTNALFKQWVERAKASTPGMEVGTIQGGTCQVGHLTIAMAQTLRRYLRAGGKFWRQFGCVVVDEAHHAAAETWEWLLNVTPAYYRFGVTASEKRSDGRQPSVRFNIGPVIYRMKFKSSVPMTIIPVETRWRTTIPPQRWAQMMRKLIEDEERNEIIARIVAKEMKAGNYTLVLSRQIKHLQNIHDHLWLQFEGDEGWLQYVELVTGKQSRSMQAAAIKKLRAGEIHCILGTQMFEEGVDIPRLDRIVLAFPGTDITVLQKVGRGSRSFEGKTETTVYDLVDDFVPSLARQWVDRKTWYKKNHIKIGSVMRNGGKEKPKGKRLKGVEFIKSLRVSRAR